MTCSAALFPVLTAASTQAGMSSDVPSPAKKSDWPTEAARLRRSSSDAPTEGLM